MGDGTLKNSIIEALNSAILETESQLQLSEYNKGEIAGLRKALTLINILSNPRYETATPIDIIIDDLPPYTETHNKLSK
ncbi:hypothetical protein R70723_11755 [Paenibacillus sp. FSL R7-0273]|uniref:hypothetical protein n=1 Tax=Paenibacillus sp. FSL R7-0273 TaxID=1536772 RepID=UPI0004F588EA|nr:hypothetical protein [Paenibacillus sp. FSL R7-0273]AIQ46470.1 hypothetical protein R70723_11755 [Paenibacillus sp. FSL R7-0273]OMF97768.1 hypothetical protein BK144_03830 [Paenibacillus sp. FSL R7-0273]